MRKAETREYWEEEVEFIEREWRKPPERRMSAFETYVKMQAKFAFADGFDELARRIAGPLVV